MGIAPGSAVAAPDCRGAAYGAAGCVPAGSVPADRSPGYDEAGRASWPGAAGAAGSTDCRTGGRAPAGPGSAGTGGTTVVSSEDRAARCGTPAGVAAVTGGADGNADAGGSPGATGAPVDVFGAPNVAVACPTGDGGRRRSPS